MTTWQAYLAANQDRYLAELLDFLSIPSISSLPEHAGDVAAAGEWVAARMKQAGIEHVAVMPTGGHPVVYGDWLHAPGKPTVLLYGHFDTQPVDPESKWTRPPFEPTLVDGKVYARGASDDKGNMLVPILAVEALLNAEGGLPLNIKFCFEGQEEIGSPTLRPFLEANKDLFAASMVISADSGQYSETEPEITLATRGLCALQVDVTGPSRDLHSGGFGGTVQNPIHALATILAGLHDEDGHISVEGFYDSVHILTPDEKAKIAAVPLDPEKYQEQLGVPGLFGEVGYSVHEQAWARPTLEVNGIWGGFVDAGMKTVLPSEAHAKITCRLVPNQNPREIAELVATRIHRLTPPGVTVETTIMANAAMPYLVPATHPGNVAAHAVLEELYGKPPYYTRTGGSVPIYELFLSALDAYTVGFGFGMDDENIHSPNEYWRLSSFAKGQQGYCMLLHELAKT